MDTTAAVFLLVSLQEGEGAQWPGHAIPATLLHHPSKQQRSRRTISNNNNKDSKEERNFDGILQVKVKLEVCYGLYPCTRVS